MNCKYTVRRMRLIIEKLTSPATLAGKLPELLSPGRNLFPLFQSPIRYNIAGQMQIDLRIQRWEKEKLANMDEEEDKQHGTL